MLLEGRIRLCIFTSPCGECWGQVQGRLQLLPSVSNSSSYLFNGVFGSDQYRLLVDQEPGLMGHGSGRVEKA